MLNLLLVAGDVLDQCSFYRLIGPYSLLSHEYSIRVPERVTAADIWLSDVVVFGRPHSRDDYERVKLARELQKLVVVDYDDDFLNIPNHHASYTHFATLEARRIFISILQLAHVVTVSTDAIFHSYNKYCARIEIIPNAFNDTLYKLPDQCNNDSKVVVWRGHHSHWKDLEALSALRELADFVFIGNVPAATLTMFPKAHFYAFQPMRTYFKLLRQLKPKIVLAPLEDTPFNRAKSNCVQLEAVYAGAIVVASPLPEFQRPGVIGVDKFTAERISDILNADLTDAFDQTHKNILRLTKINFMRERLLEELTA